MPFKKGEILFFLIFTFLLVACNSDHVKHHKELKSFLRKADKSPEKINAEDWKKMDRKFEEYIVEYREKESRLDKQQKKESEELVGQYYTVRIEHMGKQLGDEIEKLGEEFNKQMNEVIDIQEEQTNEN
jgi:hypothetical protein